MGAHRQVEESGALTMRGITVMPNAPTEAVNAWNPDTLVTLLLMTKDEICEARLGDGEVDFLVCAKKLDQVGGLSCRMSTHQTGGKDSKKRNVLKMTLPPQGGVFVIPVVASNSTVKCPKMFSSPILPQASLPYNVFNKGWDATLSTIRLRAREWKFLIEAYPGEVWIVNTCLDRGTLSMTRAVNLLKLRISPLPGEESESGPDPSLLVSDPKDKGTRVSPVPLGPFFQGQRDTSRPPDGPRRADDSVQSNGSGDSDHQGQWSVPPYVRLAPLLWRVQTLKSKGGSLQVTLPESFGVVCWELNKVWAELSNLRQATPPPDPGSASSPTYFQEWQQNSTSAARV